MTHAIYLRWPLGRTSGGPSGYLWHLRAGLERLGRADEVAFVLPSENAGASRVSGLRRQGMELLKRVPSLWRLLITYGPSQLRDEIALYRRNRPSDYRVPDMFKEALLSGQFKSVHCHTTIDLISTHNSLVESGIREQTRLLLTVHCPELPSHEISNVLVKNGMLPSLVEEVRARLHDVDVHAFTVADSVIFPCVEAREIYDRMSPAFAAALAANDVAYVYTGIEEPPAGDQVAPVRQGEGFTLGYVGRHVEVKGYDILKEAVVPLLDSLDATMVVGGAEGPLYAPEHSRWIERGWISDPETLIQSVDVFVLPNRETYFDIVALEVMALGKAILASDTGGNKALARQSAGVRLFDPTPDGLRVAIEAMARFPRSELIEFGRANKAAFDSHFRSDVFAASYLELIGSRALPAGKRT